MKKVYFWMAESCATYTHPKKFIIAVTMEESEYYISDIAARAFHKYCEFKKFTNHTLIDYKYLGTELPFYNFS